MLSLVFTLAFCTFGSIVNVKSHSWLHCSDYDGTINGQDSDEDKCNGYIRQWQSQWGATSFATDRGVNYFASGGNWCQSSFSSDIESMYDDNYPMATWSYGQEITLVWPAKNHANYECKSYIPDTSMKLYYNPETNPDNEPSGSDTVTDDWTLLIDWQSDCTAGEDGCGFQNCPDFCSDTDAAPCFQKYTVSKDDFPSAGYYTLMWYWIFNPGSPYTTCFEVYIDGQTDTDTNNDDTETNGNTETNAGTGSDTDATDNNDNGGVFTDNGGTDSDTTNTGTNGDSNTDNDNDNDSGSSSSSYDDYLVQVPICFSGNIYDETTLIDGANDADWIEDDTEASWTVLDDLWQSDDGLSWNVTIQTHTNNAGDVTTTAYDYSDGSSELCDEIADEFDQGVCEICDPGIIKLYGLTSTNTGESNNDSHASICTVSFAVNIIFTLCALFVVYM